MKAGNKPKLSHDGKRSVHVKWDSSIIALGTFPDKEAVMICNRVKYLTTTWRSIFPKPSVEWVEQSLEQSGIQVVNKRPDRQPTKKDDSQDQKGSVIGGEEISATQQIQARSLLSFATTPTQPIATEKMNPHTNWGSNIAEGGIPSRSKVQVNSTMIAPTEAVSNLIVSPPASNRTMPPIRSQQDNCDTPVAAKQTKLIETYRLERDQVQCQLVYRDLEALDDEERCSMLKRHKLHLKTEMEEVKMLMSLNRDEYNQRQLLRENDRKRKSEHQPD